MSLTPGYGETPLPRDEMLALLPEARELLGEPLTRAAVYDFEQAIQENLVDEMLTEVLDGSLLLDDLLSDYFLRDLHRRMYGDIWDWAGVYRQRELNLGVAPEQIAVELHGSLQTIHYRWEHTDDWTARELGIATHAEGVRIHPFTDGNGRTTRLHADLVFLASQENEIPELYDWDFDKQTYIGLLRAYDGHRNPRDLAAFVNTRILGE